MWPPGQADPPPAAAESAKALRSGFATLARRGALRPGATPRHAARTLAAALHGVTSAISRDPDDPDNARLSATVRDAVIEALLVPPVPGSPGPRPPAPAAGSAREDQIDLDEQPEEQ
jgi:hypothetical protein